MGMRVKLMADSKKGCLARREMARKLLDLRRSHGGRLFLSSRSADRPLIVSRMTEDHKPLVFQSVTVSTKAVSNTVQTGPIDPSLFEGLKTYLHQVRKNKAVLGRFISGSHCYEARLGPYAISPASLITLNFIVTQRTIPPQNSPVAERKYDHGRAAMERAVNSLQTLVARNVGNIEWMKLPETFGEPLLEQPKRSYWMPLVAPAYYNPTVFEVLIPVYARV